MSKTITIHNMPPQPVVSIRRTVPVTEIATVLDQALPAIWAYLQQQGIQPAGPPFSRYHSFTSDKVDIEAGLPVGAPVSVSEAGMVASQLPGGKIASVTHIGPFNTLPQTYMALETWVKEHGHEQTGPLWEVYVTDPGQEPDSSKWQTEIFCPLK